MDYFSIDLSKLRTFDDGHGYLCFYMTRQNGRVSLQRHILSVYLGRWLGDDEVVWFNNKDRQDVRLEKLKLVTQTEFLELIAPETNLVELTCGECGKPFTIRGHNILNGICNGKQ